MRKVPPPPPSHRPSLPACCLSNHPQALKIHAGHYMSSSSNPRISPRGVGQASMHAGQLQQQQSMCIATWDGASSPAWNSNLKQKVRKACRVPSSYNISPLLQAIHFAMQMWLWLMHTNKYSHKYK